MRTIYRAGCAIVLLWAVSDFAFVVSAWAQSRQRIGFDINQPSLSKALLDFSAQSHIVVTVRSELVEGKTAPAVKGEMTPEEVLEKLLQGSGLRFKKGQEGEIVIEGPAPGEAKAVSPRAAPRRAAPKRAASSRVEVEEVAVTASRLREESVQDTPIAVSVISAKTVETLHQTNIQALSAIVPNLNIMTNAPTPGMPVMTLRGFNAVASDVATEPGVPVYIDGVYQPLITGSFADLYDVERVEVLRGPQGTLLGKNAAAGAVLITRSRPTGKFGGKAEVEYGSYNLLQAQSLMNFPILKNVLAGKIYGNYRHRDAWVTNLAVPGGDLGAESNGTVRGALLFTPTGRFKLYLTGDYLYNRDSQMGGQNISRPTSLGCKVFGVCGIHNGMRRVTSAGFLTKPKRDDNNFAARADWDLGSASLTSISGYRKYTQTTQGDIDQSPFPILDVSNQRYDLDSLSQELRLASAPGGWLNVNGKLTWLIAGYVGYSDTGMTQLMTAFGNPTVQVQEVIRNNYALVGHADFSVTDAWTISFGLRESWDSTKHRYSLPTPGKQEWPALGFSQKGSWDNFSIEGGTQYELFRHKMVYFRYAEGYRGGGFVGLPASAEAAAVGYGPETARSYELGAKTQWLGGRFLFNLTYFDGEFSDLQRTILQPGPRNVIIQVTQNAAKATTKGVEVESVIRPLDQLNVHVTFGYLDAGYDKYHSLDPATGKVGDLSNLPFEYYAPQFTASLAPDYRTDLGTMVPYFGRADIQAMYNWRSHFNADRLSDPAGDQRAYGTLDASVTLGPRHGNGTGYEVQAYVKNMLDQEFISSGSNISNHFQWHATDIGRTIGVTFRVRF